jgi:hypothetical protein
MRNETPGRPFRIAATGGLALLALLALGAAAGRNGGADLTEKQVLQPRTDGRRIPVVVELFTSEGCSSCPPADRLLARLDQEQPVPAAEIIPLELHVDYWNRLGWADPFSSNAFSARQYGYADAFGGASVYTPQMVVDGRAELVGSDERRARQAVARAAQEVKANVEVGFAENPPAADATRLRVRVTGLSAVSGSDTPEVLLAVTQDNLAVDVPRGENAGRRLSHRAVVRRLEPLGRARPSDGVAFTAETIIRLEKDWRREDLRVVVFVQQRKSRRILGAASARFPVAAAAGAR